MKQVSYFLPKVRANRYTFYNLSEKDKEEFRRRYNYLKKHKDKKITFMGAKIASDNLKVNDLDYLRKFSAMGVLITAIIHKRPNDQG